MNPLLDIDTRLLPTGLVIPSTPGGYVDQPQIVVNDDGSWTCVITTGAGHEGEGGQHIASALTYDRGQTWTSLAPIEPPTGPEASWAQLLRVPRTGRLYVFYTYNKSNQREVKTIDGGVFTRVDSLGSYAYRYSDDCGRSWSEQRYEIPMRQFKCDQNNIYQGKVMMFWGVAKPLIHRNEVILPATKVGAMGEGFFAQNEGVTFHSSNLLTEDDPALHQWETRPDGDVGIIAPTGSGPIAGEFNVAPMNCGSLYATLRTIDGYACHAYSHDDGRSWDVDWMHYTPDGRKVKHPRAANFVWRCANGHYLYWFHNHGGEPLAKITRQSPGIGYDHRNPAWLCGGIEHDGKIHWSEPEIALYDDQIGVRFSYPDLIEDNGRYFISETQKSIARVHELDKNMLQGMWQQAQNNTINREGLILEHEGNGNANMPTLPPLHNVGDSCVDRATGVTHHSGQSSATKRGGFTVDLYLKFDRLTPWQTVLDNRDQQGHGIHLMTTDRGTLQLTLSGPIYSEPGSKWSGGSCQSSWQTDIDRLSDTHPHHVVFIVDGGPKIISVLVDGKLCDGADQRQFGWGRFHPDLKDANGSEQLQVGMQMHGTVLALRIYNRCLTTSQAVAHFHKMQTTHLLETVKPN